FYDNPLGIDDSLENHYYKYPAIPPRMPWIDSIAPAAPVPIGILETDQGYRLKWKDGDHTDQTTQFVIYRFPEGVKHDRSNPKYILKIVNKSISDLQSYIDTTAEKRKHYTYEITALDRLHNESGVNEIFKVSSENVRQPKAV